MAHGSGCRNLIIVIVALAVAGASWWIVAPPEPGILYAIAKMVGAVSSFVLFVTFYGFVVNIGRIVDWFVVRNPPTVHDAVLGDLRYKDGQWSTSVGAMRFWLEGRRRGPDEQLVRAGAEAVSNLADYERRARAFALARLPSAAPFGTLRALSAEPRGQEKVVLMWFDLSGDPEDYLRVMFVAGEPTEAEAPNRPDEPPAASAGSNDHSK